ncbi:MAG: DNA methyltransferase [Candidatus Poribacteria bacterium]|nr:DNA methyltransferase [Candidatus Poribacteria bacterium]
MLTKSQIDSKKLNPDSPFFKNALAPTRDETTLLFLLDNLGKLPTGFNGELFVPLLTHANPKIRMLAAKNVGKLKNEKFLTKLSQFAADESNTFARREAISAIGRMRSEKAIPILIRYLTDQDPKVILQSVRALLYFKEKPEIQTALDSLREHPNELIREHLASETKNKKSRRYNRRKDPHHPTSPDALKNVIAHADVQEVLKLIPDESIHLTFTSPPYYNARDYTIYQSYEAYLDFLTAIFKETHRITKDGRFFVLNTSPVIVPRISRAHSSKRYAIPYDMHPRLTDIGWEFIDDIVWTKPDHAAKNRNGGFFQHRKPLGYKANSVTESVMVYRKKTDKLIDWNIRQYDDETVEASKVIEDYEKTNLWHINPATDKVHPAVFPPELAARVVRFYSFKGDLIFDPFGGSGTVGYVALTHERYFLLCEKEIEYVERTKQMLDAHLFADTKPRSLSLTELESELAERNQNL